ncbi:MAG TPA: ABC transporter permease [Pseudonocardiaceae bacterium]|jgi:lipooligosaccharide transport system permease protein|nr:ABC transporter permease [Pseudonocardiaceae bacterium]
MAAEIIAPRSTGRALGPVRSTMLVVAGHWAWYRRNWTATAISSVALPVLYLLAMGLGFGSQVRSTAALGGHSYLTYIAPALMAVAAVQNAAGEGTFPVLGAFKWHKTYFGVTATPITPDQVVAGQFVWMALRMLASGAVYLIIAVAIGAITSPLAIVSLFFSVLCGMAFAAPVVAYAATVVTEGNGFNVIFRFIVVPMTLFSGTMFPVSQLPVWIQPLAWITPLWHGTELARGIALGDLGFWAAIGHILFLVAMFAVGAAIARVKFRNRLTS